MIHGVWVQRQATGHVGALDTSVHVVQVPAQWAAVDENGLTKLGVP